MGSNNLFRVTPRRARRRRGADEREVGEADIEVFATMEVRQPLAEAGAHARRAEQLGYDGLSVPEAVHDGMLVALLCLEHTSRLRVATGAIVAFARSPMLTAQGAWDLQRLSGGRFELGLGSQVKGNLEGRFGVAWSPPAPRMRDYVLALRAIFARWQDGTPLAFESAHYRLTRMQPYFDPGPLEHPRLPIWLGAVNPGMTRVAGEVADGVLMHPTNSDPRTLREVTQPALAAGAARSGRRAGDVAIQACPFIATGRNRERARRPRARSSARRSPSCTRRPSTGPRSCTTAGATWASSCIVSPAREPGGSCAGC